MNEIRKALAGIIRRRERLHGSPIVSQQYREEFADGKKVYRPSANWAGETLVSREDVVDEATAIAWLACELGGLSAYRAASHALRAVLRGERMGGYCEAPKPSWRQLYSRGGYTQSQARAEARRIKQSV